jgi:branched-chain amino acid transport system ATP-binding protein
MTSAPLLAVEGLSKRFGGVVALDALDLAVHDGEAHAVIGPNGAGKTTLIAQLAGEVRPSAGRIRFAGRDITDLPAHARVRIGIARSFQITSLLASFSALENVQVALRPRQGHSFRPFRDAARDQALNRRAAALLAQVGLAERTATPAAELAHGEQRQLELAMALAAGPRLMLLDEPMAGVGHDEAQRMLELLLRIRRECALLLVEHDMDAVFRIADRITVLVGGRVLASGTPEAIRTDPRVREAYLGAAPEQAAGAAAAGKASAGKASE